ncbi:uncharacterized protein A4U43_C01F750 [Asparagus officinalis]|uniref:Uncharacterized protein n=1 Tax=Asparagus officinalis TaxID=4686 RepID=A0A5P1FKP7_ASPOF|nr:uncharacterized protein A4U43_C01F750 [Asparagus officinalis]
MAPKTAVDRSKVVYPSVPLPQHGDLGVDGTQVAATHPHYSTLKSIPLFGEWEPEEVDLHSEPSIFTFRRMITNAPLESINRKHIVKPILLFGDSSEDPDLLDIETYEWFKTVNG